MGNANIAGIRGGVFLCITILASLLLCLPAYAADTIAPAAPAGVRVAPGDTAAYLSWDANKESDLAGYNVYRSETAGGTRTKVNSSLVSKATAYFTNTGLVNGKTYYYRITAVDTSNNESEMSTEVAIKPDKPTVVNVSGTLTGNITWKSNTIYKLQFSTNLDANAVLNIDPGAIVKFGRNFYVYGTINARGMPNNKVIFTAYEDDSVGGDTNGDGSATLPETGDWSGIRMKTASSVNLENSVVRYGYYGINYYAPSDHYYDSEYFAKRLSLISSEVSNCYKGVYILGLQEAIVRNTVIKDNETFGIMIVHCENPDIQSNKILNNGTSGVNSKAVEIDPIALPKFNNNTVSGNTQNAVWIWDAVKSTSGTPNKFSSTGANATLHGNIVYVLYGSVWVSPGTVLSIQPGAVIKGEPGAIVVKGELKAPGTVTKPVVFTSYKDSIHGGQTHDSATIPSTGDWYGLHFDEGSKGTITGVKILYAKTAIDAEKAAISIKDSIIEENGFGVKNASGSPVIFAEKNWWGSADGPKPFGSGNAISSNVDADPWLISPPSGDTGPTEPPIEEDAPPAISISTPTNGATVTGRVYMKALANDDKGVAKVEFYIDGKLRRTEYYDPYDYTWDSSSVAVGPHKILAKAYDTAGKTAQHEITVYVEKDTAPPTISISTPANGATVSGSVYMKALASDNVAIRKVEFYVNGALKKIEYSAPYEYTWDSKAVSNGAYNILAKAYDTSNNTASAEITINVIN